MAHYCNAKCKFNDNPEQVCTVSKAFHVDKLCVTFRRRPIGINYKELMNAKAYRREHGAIKANHGSVLK